MEPDSIRRDSQKSLIAERFRVGSAARVARRRLGIVQV
jgi:hypothetical protein